MKAVLHKAEIVDELEATMPRCVPPAAPRQGSAWLCVPAEVGC